SPADKAFPSFDGRAVMALLLTHASSPTILCQPILFLPFLTSPISSIIHIYGFNQIGISF
ncbi:TPA: hypothetical protein ACKE2S_002291, partial [Clostridioides difficile]